MSTDPQVKDLIEMLDISINRLAYLQRNLQIEDIRIDGHVVSQYYFMAVPPSEGSLCERIDAALLKESGKYVE